MSCIGRSSIISGENIMAESTGTMDPANMFSPQIMGPYYIQHAMHDSQFHSNNYPYHLHADLNSYFVQHLRAYEYIYIYIVLGLCLQL